MPQYGASFTLMGAGSGGGGGGGGGGGQGGQGGHRGHQEMVLAGHYYLWHYE